MPYFSATEEGFCGGSSLWDANLTWHTHDPDFTACFHQTVLVYVPTAFILLALPWETYLARSGCRYPLPRTPLNVARDLIALLLVVLGLFDFFYSLFESDFTLAPSYTLRSFAAASGFLAAMVLQTIHRRKGSVTSATLFLFWGLSTFCQALTFRSVLRFEETPGTLGEGLAPYVTLVVQFPLTAAAFLLHFWADTFNKEALFEDKEEKTRYSYASFPSKVVFSWFDSFVYKAWKKDINKDDLWGIDDEHKCKEILRRWNESWDREKKKKLSGNGKFNVMGPLFWAFKDSFFKAAICQLLYATFQFASPQLVDSLITFVSTDAAAWKGYFYVALMFILTSFNTIMNSQSFYNSYILGLKIRSTLTSAIYEKSVRLRNDSRKNLSVGETTNLMAVDSQRLMDFSLYVNMMWSSPLQIALAMFFLWQKLGPAALAGLAVMVVLMPMNIVIGRKMKAYTSDQMKNKDKRVKLMNEILNGIKVLKLYAWEPSFATKISNSRVKEINALKKTAILSAVTTFLWSSAPFLVALASFATYVLIDENNVLDANTAFVSLTLFNLLRIPLNFLPMMIVYAIQCKVSLDRINAFMNAGELDLEAVGTEEDKDYAVRVENVDMGWERDGPSVLKNLDFKIEKGSLTAVVGQVGTGKSSLLSAILGEMEFKSGSINVDGRTVYAPQQAWLKNTDIRANITFNKDYDKKFYDKIVKACALGPDLDILPAGDLTEIGEKGINLSGGQKQRISVARCVYNDGDVYLLDDPLSAVDPHVGKHIFNKVISSDTGMLKKKTRILVTHGVSYLPSTDKIIVMKDGAVSEIGTYEELLRKNGEFSEFLIQYLSQDQEGKEGDKKDVDSVTVRKDLESLLGEKQLKRRMSEMSDVKSDDEERASITSDNSIAETVAREDDVVSTVSGALEPVVGQKIIGEETMAIGGVKWAVYLEYLKKIGFWFFAVSFFFYLSFQGFSLGANLWLSKWSDDSGATIADRNRYLMVYGVLGFLQSISIMIGTATLTLGTLNAAMKMHGNLLASILRAPLSFFDTTPLGRILNRFSKDIDIVDTILPMNFRMFIVQLLSVCGSVVAICIALPVFLAAVVPVALLYLAVQKIYIRCARQVKRLESVSRSPIYTNFSETLSGISTIKAFGLSKKFISENERKIDFNQKCYFPSFVANRWLAVRLETLGNLLILFAALFSVIFRDSIEPGMVGLSLSYSLGITMGLNMLVRMSSEVETNMVSMERIKEYEVIPHEAPYDIPDADPPASWPEHGVIEFRNYQTRYREGLDLVLKGITCTIESGEKVGVVGRTGAGKSSLTLALFRIIEAASGGGSIYIDGENIKFLGLGKLRYRLTIIPQDPVLFTGSLRMNIDPFGIYSDKEIWTALEHAHLKSFASNLPDGLFYEITEGGGNLSVGQKQLICLARALLRKTRILILDEATASVDLETDDLIQATIRKEFSECTVLTIAHRLNTIMDSNRIMVLDAGRIAEFDSPGKLLENPKSLFRAMVNNRVESDH